MAADSVVACALARHRDVDGDRASWSDAPKRRGTLMAECCAGATDQGRGLPEPAIRDIRPPNSEDAPPKRIHPAALDPVLDRKSTRLNSSHQIISYAVFCL